MLSEPLYLLNDKHHLRAVVTTRDELLKYNEPTRAGRWTQLAAGLWVYFFDHKEMFVGTVNGFKAIKVDIAAKLKRRKS